MLYSKSSAGFFDCAIHGDNIPADAVAITAEEHRELIEGQSNGKRIVANAEGFPVLADPPEPTPEEIQSAKNAQGRAYLASTDWYVVRLAETGAAIPEDVIAARQAARDSIVE